MTSGYFDKENFKANQESYPNLAVLDENVKSMLGTKQARDWCTSRKEMEICRIHPVYWLEKYGFIRKGEVEGGEEEVGIIPFSLNNVQLQISNQIAPAFHKKPWKRVQRIVLKHRKAGISTLIAGYDYWLLRFIRGMFGFAIADLGSHTDNIMAMIQMFHEKDKCGAGLDPKFRRPTKMPMPGKKKGLKLSNASMMERDSGENSNPGTSGTINILHMSENAKWRDPGNAETSLLNSMPRKGFVFAVKESTAFGLNKYAKDCEEAEKGRTNWDFTFISWKDLPDCEYELSLGEEVKYSEEEAELVAAYKLRPGHIKFRRDRIELLGSIDKFRQDFPLNSREPFLITGSPFFNPRIVQDRINQIKFYRDWREMGWEFCETAYPEVVQRVNHHPRGKREALAVIEDREVEPQQRCLTINNGKVTLLPEKKDRDIPEALTVFHGPAKNKRYLVVIDVAEGIQTDEYTSDNSIIEVLDPWRREQVAEWGGIFDEEMTAHYAVMIARLYNDADIAPEMNNKCGGLLKAELEKTGYRKFFQRQRVSAQGRGERQFGWETTAGNKKEVCGQFRMDFKNQDCLIHSLPLLEEMLYFTDTKGRLEASSGTDDRVMATSIGLKIIASTPVYTRPVKNPVVDDRNLQIYSEHADPFVTTREERKREAGRRYC